MSEREDRAGAVAVAYVHSTDVSHSWHHSIVELVGWDIAHHARIVRGGYISIRCGTDGLVEARNRAVREFLAEPTADWLFWCDTDMGFAGDTVDRLFESADPVERPVVGALCFSQREVDSDGTGGWRTLATPTVFDWAHDGDQMGFAVRWDYPRDALTQCAGTGSACILVHRSVLERIEEKFGPVWYDRTPNVSTGQLVGEDLSFCMRVGALGIPIHVDTGVRSTHHKPVWLGERDYWMQRAVNPPPSESIPNLSVHVDIEASLASVARNEHAHDGMLKLPADMDRYARIMSATQPDVVVEAGSHTGASARWLADHGVDVVTVDKKGVSVDHPRVTCLTGDAADPEIATKVAEIVGGRRCMVSLDSDHSAEHVSREIELYGPLVSPGCYLVVEDGIFGYAPQALRAAHGMGAMKGSPLDAIAKHLPGNPDWSRDVAIERTSPVTHHPAGYWRRNG